MFIERTEKAEQSIELPMDVNEDRAISRAGGEVDGRVIRFARETKMAEQLGSPLKLRYIHKFRL